MRMSGPVSQVLSTLDMRQDPPLLWDHHIIWVTRVGFGDSSVSKSPVLVLQRLTLYTGSEAP